MGYLMPNSFWKDNSNDTIYLTHSWENKEVHTFPKGIHPKVNVIKQLGFKLAYLKALYP